MKKESIWRNSSMQMAVLAALAASIAGYLIFSSGAFSNGKPVAAGKKALIAEKVIQRPAVDGKPRNEQKMLMALRISDYEILKPRLKKGLRINIIYGEGPSQDNGLRGKTILEDILVAEVPPNSSSRLSSGEQGILIEITKEDGERLAGIAGLEPIRILIKGD